MFSDKDIQELVVSVGGKKVTVTPDHSLLSQIAANLPSEVADLLSTMQGQISRPVNPTTVISEEAKEIFSKMQTTGYEESSQQINKRNISETNPYLGAVLEKELRSQPVPEAQNMIRARSAELQIAYDRQLALEEIKNAPDLKKKLTIYECGVALGIIVGSSNKTEVINIMKNFSKITCPDDNNDLMFFYSDIQVTVFYNDDMIVSELQFGDYYRGQTNKGLQLGDPIEKAIELYGPPRMKSPRGAFWNKFGVFCQNNRVNSIRIQA